MVLEIKIPELTLDNLSIVFQQVLIYGVSFVCIAILWLNHHHIFVKVEKVPINIVWINFALLFFTSLLPKATEHLSSNFHQVANHIFFGLTMAIITFLYSLIEMFVMKQSNRVDQKANRRNWISVVLWLLSVLLCFVNLYLSSAIFVLLPIIYFLVSKKEIQQ